MLDPWRAPGKPGERLKGLYIFQIMQLPDSFSSPLPGGQPLRAQLKAAV
jgi:hypothetical protein